MTSNMLETSDLNLCPKCERAEGSFACRIRHIQMNTGAAKAAKD